MVTEPRCQISDLLIPFWLHLKARSWFRIKPTKIRPRVSVTPNYAKLSESVHATKPPEGDHEALKSPLEIDKTKKVNNLFGKLSSVKRVLVDLSHPNKTHIKNISESQFSGFDPRVLRCIIKSSFTVVLAVLTAFFRGEKQGL